MNVTCVRFLERSHMLGCYQVIAILIRVMERTHALCEGVVLAVAGAEQGRQEADVQTSDALYQLR